MINQYRVFQIKEVHHQHWAKSYAQQVEDGFLIHIRITRVHIKESLPPAIADDSPEAVGRKAAKHIYWPLLWCWRCDRMG